MDILYINDNSITNLIGNSIEFDYIQMSKLNILDIFISNNYKYNVIIENIENSKKYMININFNSKKINCSCKTGYIVYRGFLKFQKNCDHILFFLYKEVNITSCHFLNKKKLSIEETNYIYDYIYKYIYQCNKIFYDLVPQNIENVDCYICLDALKSLYNTVCCLNCKNLVHSDCVSKWLKSNKNKTCIYCRSICWKNFKIITN